MLLRPPRYGLESAVGEQRHQPLHELQRARSFSLDSLGASRLEWTALCAGVFLSLLPLLLLCFCLLCLRVCVCACFYFCFCLCCCSFIGGNNFRAASPGLPRVWSFVDTSFGSPPFMQSRNDPGFTLAPRIGISSEGYIVVIYPPKGIIRTSATTSQRAHWELNPRP